MSYTSSYDAEGVAAKPLTGGVCPIVQSHRLAAPPVFVATTPLDAAELHEAPTSPTIDAGASASPPAVDIDGQPRIAGAAIDIGADEYPSNSGPNLIGDGDAESGPLGSGLGLPSPWSVVGPIEQLAYGTSGFPDAAEAARIRGGSGFLSGGANTATSSATQRIDISPYAAAIDAGTETATLSAFSAVMPLSRTTPP